jgi:hypothetical protein
MKCGHPEAERLRCGKCRICQRAYNARPDVKARKQAWRHSPKGQTTELAYRNLYKTDLAVALMRREHYRTREAKPDRKLYLTKRRGVGIDRNTDAKVARRLLNAAVQSGKVIRLPCEACGNQRSHGHHEDYTKPLDVRWLCATCHRREHSDERLAKQFGITVDELRRTAMDANDKRARRLG